MDDTLDFLACSRIFCTLYLSQGFHQVPLEPSSQPLTAFCTDRGIYEYTKMPFGLINAPAHFQWTMNRILAGLIGTRCVVYIDDVLVFGKEISDLLETLSAVLERFAQYGLILNKEKCLLGVRQCEFLGFGISEKGRKIAESKLKDLLALPPPRSKKD
ncbi:reverse transcriptase family protein, partial [Aduncisulcus paluster]